MKGMVRFLGTRSVTCKYHRDVFDIPNIVHPNRMNRQARSMNRAVAIVGCRKGTGVAGVVVVSVARYRAVQLRLVAVCMVWLQPRPR